MLNLIRNEFIIEMDELKMIKYLDKMNRKSFNIIYRIKFTRSNLIVLTIIDFPNIQ